MRLSVGISTVIENLDRVKRQIKHLADLGRPDGMDVEVLVVVQDGFSRKSKYDEFINWVSESVAPQNGFGIRTFYDPLRGLSRSRNVLLREFSGDWLHICDDDVVFRERYFYVLEKVLPRLIEYEFVTFEFGVGEDCEERKWYWKRPRMHTLWSVFHVSSVEIFLSRGVRRYGVWFDERFGLGGIWPSGEENLFLAQLLKRGASGVFIPYKLICLSEYGDTSKYGGWRALLGKYHLYHGMYGAAVGDIVFLAYFTRRFLKWVKR